MTTPTVLALALTLLGSGQQSARPHPDRDRLQLAGEALVLEYSVTFGEATLKLEAESEQPLERVRMNAPDGAPVFDIVAPNGRQLALSGFILETRELSPETLLESYPAGVYALSGRTSRGEPIEGSAQLSHVLPAAPVVLYPTEGALGVPAKGLRVRWSTEAATEAGVSAYQISLEQDDNDGMSARVPGHTGSFLVPDGVLRRGVETQVEIAAIGANGNRTLVEVTFTTR